MSPEYIAALKANAKAPAAPQKTKVNADGTVEMIQTAAPEQKKGRSGLLKWLPTALGVAGTLAAAPFTGGTSLAGTAAILGGSAAVGAGLGEFGAQKLNKEKTNLGAVGKEALISGITGAIPIGGAAKTARVAGKVAAEQAGKTAVEEAAAKGLTGKLARAGKELIAATEGTQTGAVVRGAERVTPKMEAKIGAYLESIGSKGSPKDKLIQIAEDKAATGKKIGELVKAAKDPSVKISDLSTIVGKAQKSGIMAKNAQTETTNLFRSAIGGAKTKEELQSIKLQLDDELASFYKKVENGTASRAEEKLLKAYRDGIKDVMKDIPGYAEANSRYSTALTAEKLLLKAPKASNLKVLGVDTGIGGKLAQRSKDTIGRLMQKPSAITESGAGGLTSRVLKEGFKQYIPREVLGAGAVQPDTTTQLPDTTQPTLAAGTMGASDNTQIGSTENDPITQQITAYKQAAINAAAAGDMKAVKSITDTISMLSDLQPAPEKKKALNSTAAGVVTDLESGIANLEALSSTISSSGSNIPVVGGLLAKNPFNTDAQTTRAKIATAKQLIGKALEGGVLRKEDEIKYAAILPTMNDSDVVAQAKIADITQQLKRKLNIYQQNLGAGDGGVDLAALQGVSQ